MNYKLLKLIPILLIPLIISACQTWEQRKYKERVEKIKAAKQAVREYCEEQIEENPEVNDISNKLAFFYSNITFSMRANNSKATNDEVENIAVFADIKDKCTIRSIKIRKRTFPSINSGFISIQEIARSKLRSALVRLYNKEVTYSQFYKIRDRIESIRKQQNSDLKTILKRDRRQAQYQSRQLEVESRKARAMEEQANTAAEKARHDAFRPSSTITCERYGNRTTCSAE